MLVRFSVVALISWMVLISGVALAAGPPSANTTQCIRCHQYYTPGIVVDWQRSRHAKLPPREALKLPELERRISVETLSKEMDKQADYVVGCAECHMMRNEEHADAFDHNGFRIHVIVTPDDCAVCHPVEREQYAENLMSQAYGNLMNNPVYTQLVDAINGGRSFHGGELKMEKAQPGDNEDSCLQCHGSLVEVVGEEERQTMIGPMAFPKLANWPNQGVGRINPDGSKGACTSCHPRHEFSIEVARKPETCAQCHKGPDVPAYPVYQVSKHGNIYSSSKADWDFKAVPWKLGDDFTAPTCAACHVSLLTQATQVLSQRTHKMSDRLPHRIFGPIYAHPHPESADTTLLENRQGLPLPVNLDGTPVAKGLIFEEEQAKRREEMRVICLACHSGQWADGFFARLDRTIEATNQSTVTATNLLADAWENGFATQSDSLFNEPVELEWVRHWLFYANSTRFASAMGGADYGVFANGRFMMNENLAGMAEWLEMKKEIRRLGEMKAESAAEEKSEKETTE